MPERMTLEQARSALGHEVAFNAHGGQWVTGRLVAVADTPQLFVDLPDGTRGVYTLSTVDGWAMAAKGCPVDDLDVDVADDAPTRKERPDAGDL